MSPKYLLIYKDCCISKFKRGSAGRGQSSPGGRSMVFSQTMISLPRLGALWINRLPAAGPHRSPPYSPSQSPNPLPPHPRPSPSALSCFLQHHPWLTLNAPACSLCTDHPTIPKATNQRSPLRSNGFPSGLTIPSSVPSPLSWPLHCSLRHPALLLFLPLHPNVAAQRVRSFPLPFSLFFHPTVRHTDCRPNLRC